jgi:hypothetical protein
MGRPIFAQKSTKIEVWKEKLEAKIGWKMGQNEGTMVGRHHQGNPYPSGPSVRIGPVEVEGEFIHPFNQPLGHSNTQLAQ